VRTALFFLFIINMALPPVGQRVKNFIGAAGNLPPSGVQNAAAQLGGSVSRGIGKAAEKVSPILQRAGLQKQAEGVQNLASGVAAFQKSGRIGTAPLDLTGSRALGYVGMGAGLSGAFVGGMGANSGIHALMGYQLSDPRTSVQGDTPRIGGNVMPADLQTSYIALNQPGSPLGIQMMRQNVDVKAAQDRQRLLRAAMTGMMGGMGEEA
jgi:hypothetical protein